jgi:adenine-specific DNA-methyltransferase
MLVRMLLDNLFGQNNFRNEIIVRRAEESKGDLNKQFGSIRSITVNYDNLYWYSVNPNTRFSGFMKKTTEHQSKAHWHSFWKAEDRPNMRYNLLGLDLNDHYGQWMWSKERAYRAVRNYEEFKNISEQTGISLEEYWTSQNQNYLEENGVKLEFIERFGNGWSSIKYWIPPRTEVMSDNNWLDIKGYSNSWKFKTENSEILLQRVIGTLSEEREIILDYFDGSGTTTATAHKMNRRWIGIEMGEYFNMITKRRMINVLAGDSTGISKDVNFSFGGIFKYNVLETYEDTLNNLFLKPTTELDFTGKAKEEYLLQYMLELESRDNLFNLEMFRKPFDYQLKVTENNELKPTKVDLVETFNYLIGLYVSKVQRVKDIKVVEGTTRTGIKTLVIWRDLETTTHEEVEKLLRRFYDSQRTREFQQIYINGDHHLENLRSEGDQFKIKLIEETFFKKMFNEIEL